MLAEFFHVTNNGQGYHTTKTINVDQWLPMQTYAKVAYQKINGSTFTETEMYLDDLGLYTHSFISKSIDNLHRETLDNFTIMIKYSDLAKEKTSIDRLNFRAIYEQYKDIRQHVIQSITV